MWAGRADVLLLVSFLTLIVAAAFFLLSSISFYFFFLPSHSSFALRLLLDADSIQLHTALHNEVKQSSQTCPNSFVAHLNSSINVPLPSLLKSAAPTSRRKHAKSVVSPPQRPLSPTSRLTSPKTAPLSSTMSSPISDHGIQLPFK